MFITRTQQSIAAIMALLMLFLLPGVAAAQGNDDKILRPDGIGNAVLAMTADELIEALGDDYDVSDEVRITVDYEGRVISQDGEVQFRAAMADGSGQLTLFIVSNDSYATAEGVGPTTTIADAEEIYGEATLSWDPDDAGREFVTFANGPDQGIAFRTPGIGGNNVGIYADDVFETTDYDEDAQIAAVWLSCTSGTDCPLDDVEPAPTPEPTPTEEPEPTATAEPEATPEPTPTPAADDDGEGDDADDDAGMAEGDTLPRTGATELVLLATVSALFVLGGAMVLVERRYLCPAWLRR